MSVKKRQDGRWESYLRYKDSLGRTHQKRKTTFKTKHAALMWEREFLNLRAGKALPGLTVKELALKYLESMEKVWRWSTYQTIENRCRNHVIPVIGNMKVEDITPQTIHAYQNTLRASGLKAATQRKLNTLLFSIMQYGVEYCGLSHNPMQGIKFHCVSQPMKYHIWTQAQFQTFINRIPDNELKGQGKIFKLFLKVLYWGGFRKGEALALTIGDIDLKHNTIKVTKNRGCGDRITPPKTSSSKRLVIMPRHIMSELKNYIQRIYEPEETQFVFPMSYNNVYSYWDKLRKTYGKDLPRLRMHDLRHSHASQLMDMHIMPKGIADRLGHRSTRMVEQVYAHLYDKRRQEIADELDKLLE